jgi:hypothetical protein
MAMNAQLIVPDACETKNTRHPDRTELLHGELLIRDHRIMAQQQKARSPTLTRPLAAVFLSSSLIV